MPVIIKYLIVYGLSGLKIIFGPTLGMAYGLSVLETALLSLAGMMTTVYLISYFGPEIKSFCHRFFVRKKKRRIFSKRTRRFVRIWNSFGVQGLAFFTPILLSPLGGTILANAFGGKRREIIKWMWVFGGFWSIAITLFVKYAKWVLVDFGVI